MVLEFSYSPPSCGQPDHRPAVLADVHYLYFALILLALTCLIIVAVSLATAPIPKENVRKIPYIIPFLISGVVIRRCLLNNIQGSYNI